MTGTRESQRLLVGAIIGALFGLVFGGMTAIGAAHGDREFRSGMRPVSVFLLSFLGWLLSAIVITKLWKRAHDERSANWIGMISVVPLTLTSLAVALPPSELFSISTLIPFVIGDAFVGIVVGESAWQQFGNAASQSDAALAAQREAERTVARKAPTKPGTSLLLFLAVLAVVVTLAIAWL